MGNIIASQLVDPKSMAYDGAVPRPGAFNVLNTPDSLYSALGPDRFWDLVNRPFLDAAIGRGDDIYLATKPSDKTLLRRDGSISGFGREYSYLVEKGYIYDPMTGKICKGGCK